VPPASRRPVPCQITPALHCGGGTPLRRLDAKNAEEMQRTSLRPSASSAPLR